MTQEQFNVADLEKAAEKYVSTLCDRADEGLRIDTTLESAFIAGAKWEKNVLLEWVNEKLTFCKEMILKGEPGFEFKLSVYEKLIEKFNEL